MIDIDVDVHDAVARASLARAEATLPAEMHAGEVDVAQHAAQQVRARLGLVLRHPTGRYMSTVDVVRSADPYVDGNGTVYGPWLEGEGSRNRSTRFKGYHSFRIVAAQVERSSGDIMEDRLDRWADRV